MPKKKELGENNFEEEKGGAGLEGLVEPKGIQPGKNVGDMNRCAGDANERAGGTNNLVLRPIRSPQANPNSINFFCARLGLARRTPRSLSWT